MSARWRSCVELLPLLEIAEDALGRLEERHEDRQRLRLSRSRLTTWRLWLATCGSRRPLQPGSLRRCERERGGEEREEADNAGEHREAPVARVEEVGQERETAWRAPGAPGRGPSRSGVTSSPPGNSTASSSWSPGRAFDHVLELPRPAEILRDRVVDLGERLRSTRLRSSCPLVVIDAICCKRSGENCVALDADRVHGDTCTPARPGSHRRAWRPWAPRCPPSVRRMRTRAGSRLAAEQLRSRRRRRRRARCPLPSRRVIVRSAESASIVDVEKPVSENAVDPNARTDDAVGRRLGGDEGARCGRGLGRAPGPPSSASGRWRSRRSSRRRGSSPSGRPRAAPFSRQAGGRRRRRRRDAPSADARELARVDGLDLPGRLGGRGEDEDGEQTARSARLTGTRRSSPR